jgi:tetratricopeptide (TPR) repeat protein
MSLPGYLTLEVFKQGDSLKMGLFGQAQITPTLRHYSLISVSPGELSALSADMVSILNRPARDAHSRSNRFKSLQKTGQLFWDHLFSRSVKEKLKESQPCILTLSLDEELIYLPWELVFDGEEFLCLKFSLGRLVRSKGDSSLLQYRGMPERLRMLILADPNANLKSAYAEGLNIKNQFSHKGARVSVDFKSTSIDKKYVKKNICDYDIVHFAGHCEFDRRDAHKSGWALSDGVFKIEDILKMGQSSSLPALVFSNACHSAEEGAGLLGREYQKEGYGMASAFLFAGVRHYIGAIRRIEDNPSLVFAKEFYNRLVSGISVGESVHMARLKLIKEFGAEALHWVNYLLYGDPAFVFIALQKAKADKRRHAYFKASAVKVFFAALILSLVVYAFFRVPGINPSNVYLFLNSRAEYQKGNNLSAVELGEKLVKRSRGFLAVYPIIADACERLGDKDRALKYYYAYVLESGRAHDRRQLIQAYLKLGWFYHLNERQDEARELYDKAIALSRKLKDRRSEAASLRKLAVWYIDQEDFEQALDLLTKSAAINLEYSRNFDNARNLACDYFDMGLVLANKDDYEAAKDFYERRRKIFERLKLKNELSDCYFNLGEIYLLEKEYSKALEYYLKGLDIDRRHHNKVNLACGHNMVGELYLEMNDLENAREHLEASLALAGEIGSRADMASASYNLGLLYAKQGKKRKARDYWRKAQEVYREIDYDRYLETREKLLSLDNS